MVKTIVVKTVVKMAKIMVMSGKGDYGEVTMVKVAMVKVLKQR